MSEVRRVAVIGAGAAGIMAGIAAARSGAEVSLLEHTDSIGSKLLMTGNGKCNYTNTDISRDSFHSGTDRDGRIRSIITRFGYAEAEAFFKSIGIIGRERRGCIYPYTDTAESVRTALRLELRKLGVEIVCGCKNIKIIYKEGNRIRVTSDIFSGGRDFDSVIIACGGLAARKTGSDGSGYDLIRALGAATTDVYPALTPIPLTEDLSAIKGIRCEAALTLRDERDRIIESSVGELQPFENGLSGICALDISGNACRRIGAGERVFIETDYYPGCDDDGFYKLIKHRSECFPERNLTELLNGLFPKKLITYLVHPIDTRKEGYIGKLTESVKHHRYEVSPEIIKDMSRAQTTAGGVSLEWIDENCMLRCCDGIYAAGEILDADGVCGGYNLHFAWATGYISGLHAAGRAE